MQDNNYNNTTEPPSKARKLNPFSKPHGGSSSTPVYWPRDLLPETVPSARVLTYGKSMPRNSESKVFHEQGDFVPGLSYTSGWSGISSSFCYYNKVLADTPIFCRL